MAISHRPIVKNLVKVVYLIGAELVKLVQKPILAVCHLYIGENA